MKAEIFVTKRQCMEIVEDITGEGFFLSGVGHFGVGKEHFSKLLYLCLNSTNRKKRREALNVLYNQLHDNCFDE